MLTQHQKSVASFIAKELIEEGMIWGKELEWYIKLSTKGRFNFTSEDHYLEFEDLVLDMIEKYIRCVVVNDIKTGETYKFNNISECAKYLNSSYDKVRGAIFNKGIMSKRYKIKYESKSIKDLTKIS